MLEDEKNLIELFTNFGSGQYLKYAYMLPFLIDKEDKYGKLVTENNDYYFYTDEIELINQNKINLV